MLTEGAIVKISNTHLPFLNKTQGMVIRNVNSLLVRVLVSHPKVRLPSGLVKTSGIYTIRAEGVNPTRKRIKVTKYE